MVADSDAEIEDWVKEALKVGEEKPPLHRSPRRAVVETTAFPTEMSCSQVFDQLLKCYSLGGQIRHYYRYGEITYCKDKRDKLKFCLGTKGLGEDDKRNKIRQWYMELLAKQVQQKHSSEDIWSPRTVPLRRPFYEPSTGQSDGPIDRT